MYSNTFKLLDDTSFSDEIAAACILKLHLLKVVVASFHGCNLLSKVD